MSTPMKNSRKKSIINSNSKSRSNSKKKGLNMSDLNLSNNS